jgi:hypothetical protein
MLLRSWGLELHVGTAESFFDRLQTEVRRAEDRIVTEILSGQVQKLDNQPVHFLRQFRRLEAESDLRKPANHDFYRGGEPDWSDIVSGLDVEFQATRELAREVERDASGDRPRFCFTRGARGSGKTTTLLRSSYELLKRQFDVFLFRGEERLDSKALPWWAAKARPSVLLFDVADFSEDLGEALARAESEGIALRVVGAERATREKVVLGDVAPRFRPASTGLTLESLSDPDLWNSLRRLRDQARLGQITRWADKEQLRYLRQDCGGNLLVILLRLDAGGKLDERLRAELRDDISTSRLRDLYLTICIAHGLGDALQPGIAAAACGMRATEVIDERLTGGLSGLTRVSDRGLFARHRGRASLVIERVTRKDERSRLASALAKSPSPSVSPAWIHRRTAPHGLLRSPMDTDAIINWMGRAASEWYQELVGGFSWNARYWEQRALTEARSGFYERARSFAERAAKEHKDAFTLNTLGTIILESATDSRGIAASERRRRFKDGVARLPESREEGRERYQHPCTTFVSYALRYSARCIQESGAREADLLDEWAWWHKRATAAACFQETAGQEALTKFQMEGPRQSTREQGAAGAKATGETNT